MTWRILGMSAGLVLLFTGCGTSSEEATTPDECTPRTCEQLKAECGQVPNSCKPGEFIFCGGCTGAETCGGGGSNKCGLGQCNEQTCQSVGAECGIISNGCGKIVNCGSKCPNDGRCVLDSQNIGKCQSSTTPGTGGQDSGPGSSTCDPSDFCQQGNHNPGWYCNGNDRILCSNVGGCVRASTPFACANGCVSGQCKGAADDCAAKCAGHCDNYDGCACGGCGDGLTCTPEKVCRECSTGDRGQTTCSMSINLCGSGVQTRQCVGGSWGSWSECEGNSQYVGESTAACGSGNSREVLCIRVSSGNNPQAYISKFNNSIFEDDFKSLTITASDGAGGSQKFGIVHAKNLREVSVQLDMSKFSTSFPSSFKMSARMVSSKDNKSYESPATRVARCSR